MKTETIYGHLLKTHQLGEVIDLHQLITSEEIKTIEKARKTLEDPEGLRPYFDHFEEQMPYWKIKFGLYFLEQK
jgi:ATP-dependent DNA helicase RecQ